MAAGREWTNLDLMLEAGVRGYSLTERQIVDWTARGLIDQPRRRGTGRGSERAVRSDNQARLLFELLRMHRHTPKLAALANMPVYVWLGWGENYVSIRQVRRAMRTFVIGHANEPARKARQSASDHIARLGLGKVPKAVRTRLEDVLIAMSSAPQAGLGKHRDEFERALRDVVAPERTDLELPQIETTVALVDARMRGAAIFREGNDQETFPDSLMRRLQAFYKATRPDYIASTGRPPAEVNEEMMNQACVNLLTMLGSELPRLDTPRRNRRDTP